MQQVLDTADLGDPAHGGGERLDLLRSPDRAPQVHHAVGGVHRDRALRSPRVPEDDGLDLAGERDVVEGLGRGALDAMAQSLRGPACLSRDAFGRAGHITCDLACLVDDVAGFRHGETPPPLVVKGGYYGRSLRKYAETRCGEFARLGAPILPTSCTICCDRYSRKAGGGAAIRVRSKRPVRSRSSPSPASRCVRSTRRTPHTST